MNNQHPKNVKTIFISDVHLGFPGCHANHLNDFLKNHHCEDLYMVGDIIDFWYLKKNHYWHQSHNDVVRSILGKAKHGTQVHYITGNHDEALREHTYVAFGNLHIQNEMIHECVDGKQLLIIHGDQYDFIIQNTKFLAIIGSNLYNWLLTANRIVNWFRNKMGYEYWSLAKFLKYKAKNTIKYIGRFEEAVATDVKHRQLDGAVCGHIHHPEINTINGIDYLNCGSAVEGCTALIEHYDGTIELVQWDTVKSSLKSLPPRVAVSNKLRRGERQQAHKTKSKTRAWFHQFIKKNK